MWCRKLKDRPEWAPAVRELSNGNVRIKGETKQGLLDSHDIAIPTSQPGKMLRIVLLSPKDLGNPATEQRLCRLVNLRGQATAAIFLVDPAGQQTDPMETFMKLQIEMLNKFDITPIPLLAASDLPSTLACFLSSQPAPQPTVSSKSLLRHMTDGPPLSEHTTNLLSDLGNNISAIAALADTEQGRAQMADLLGESEAGRILRFLESEHCV